jgi:hypothetical protein
VKSAHLFESTCAFPEIKHLMLLLDEIHHAGRFFESLCCHCSTSSFHYQNKKTFFPAKPKGLQAQGRRSVFKLRGTTPLPVIKRALTRT